MINHINVKGRRLLVLADEVEEVSEGGIFLGVNKKAERAGQNMGTVVSIGPLCWIDFEDSTPWCKVGDRIYFSRYAGRFLQDPHTELEYMVMNDEDVLAVVEENPIDGN